MTFSATPNVPRASHQGNLPAAPTAQTLTGSMAARYDKLHEFERDLLAAERPIQWVHRAIELIGRRPERATSIAHALMGLGPADGDLADGLSDLSLAQKRIFCDVLRTNRRGWIKEDAGKTLAKLTALSERMGASLQKLRSESNASDEGLSVLWAFARKGYKNFDQVLNASMPEERPALVDSILDDACPADRLSLMKKMPLRAVLKLRVEHRYEWLTALAATHRGAAAPPAGRCTQKPDTDLASIRVLTESILSSQECKGSTGAVLAELWDLARCDEHPGSEISRFLLFRMQEDFTEHAPKGMTDSASAYEHYPLMLAISHLSTAHADQARAHLHRTDCSDAQARLMVDALAGTQEWDLLHRFLEREGYSRDTLKRLLAQASASWLSDFAASFVDLNSREKIKRLQAAVTALGNPRVSQVVRKALGSHWIEPETKPSTQREPRNERYVASKLSGVLASILVGVYRYS